jgi:hypothetical protein
MDEQRERSAWDAVAREAVTAPVGFTLQTEDIADMAERVDAMPETRFLISGLWPADAYGVIAAQDKAGKTWMQLDAAVSVASGTKWVGRYDCEQGTVLVYAGEGGARNLIRRIRAVAESKHIPFGTLTGSLRVSEAAPRLTDKEALITVRGECLMHAPKLIIIDPLYLAAMGAKGSDLYSMGETLVGIQSIAQDAGAALMLTHHWNKTGEGRGAQRMTGVGPGAWGRVLGSGSVDNDTTDAEGRSTVEVGWEFTGSEIPKTEFTVVRKVWSDDPESLTTPLHYEVETRDGMAAALFAAERRIALVENVDAYVQANPRCSSGAVKGGVTGDDNAITDALVMLQREGRIVDEGTDRHHKWVAR